jgi:uncharacterized protein YecE (DUF72 family)
MTTKYFVGCSGWHYEHWRGLFYPRDLAKPKWLSFYAQQFNTVELNNTFYRVPTEKAFNNWQDSTPDNFLFAVKVSRFITHIKRLKDLDSAVENFVSRAGLLKEKLGPLLYQLPPGMKRNDELLDSFLYTLPSEYQHVVEFRHESWIDETVFDSLRMHNVGLCVFDMPGLSCLLVATSDFAYIRFHGSEGLYCSSYSDEVLTQWAQRIAQLAETARVSYIYFNNDAEAFAVRNATKLRNLLQAPGSKS